MHMYIPSWCRNKNVQCVCTVYHFWLYKTGNKCQDCCGTKFQPDRPWRARQAARKPPLTSSVTDITGLHIVHWENRIQGKKKKRKATISSRAQRQVTGTTMLLAGARAVPFWLTHRSTLVSFQQPTQQPSQDLRAKDLLRQKHFTPNTEGPQFLIVSLVFTESKGLSTPGKITFLLLDNICVKNVKQGERFPWTSVMMIHRVELNSDGF